MRHALSLGFVFVLGCGVSTSGGSDCVGTDSDGNVTLCTPESGFQLATGAFEVAQGSEIQDCYFFRVPGEGDEIAISQIEIAQNAGTHHMNIFRVSSENNLSVEADDGTVVRGSDVGADGNAPGECWRSPNWSDWPLVVNSQSSGEGDFGYDDWQLPQTTDGRQVVHRFVPGELLMLQTHYVNATTQKTPERGNVLVNFHIAAADNIGPTVHTIFATHQSIEVAPGDTARAFQAGCNFEHPDITIIGANSHFHSRGTRFTISTGTEDGDADETFYDNESWDEPLMARDLSVVLAADRPILYECTFAFPSDCSQECEPLDTKTPSCGNGAQCSNFGFDAQCGNSFCFGPKVETMEHCNIFGYFFANDDDPEFEKNFVGRNDLACF